jgi:membrane protease YdiL (CAAX protease family)
MRSEIELRDGAPSGRTILAFGWAAFVVAGLLLMAFLGDVAYGLAIPAIAVAALVVSLAVRRTRTAVAWTAWRADRRDLAVMGILYGVVVGLLTLAFRVFTTDQTLWMFLCFAGAHVVGVVGPVVYTVWFRRRTLASLGLTLRGWRVLAVPALVFAGVQFAITLWGYDLPAPVDWVPLLVMALTVGVFESIFFRGFVQGRLEASFGTAPAVAGAAVLYALYHVGYGMGAQEMVFLLGLGVVYAVAYRIGTSVLLLWPLLTPIGSLFAQLESGDLAGELPWAAILGFADELGLMAAILWLAHKRERRRAAPAAEEPIGLTPIGRRLERVA